MALRAWSPRASTQNSHCGPLPLADCVRDVGSLQHRRRQGARSVSRGVCGRCAPELALNRFEVAGWLRPDSGLTTG
jgi:hypothetical protein